jgi:hypothetical protein
MDKSVLVSVDLDQGSQILSILDRAGIKAKVALWVYFTEYEGWRLVLSGRQFDAVPLRDAYGLVHQALRAAGIGPDSEPIFMILAMRDPFIKALRRLFGKARRVEGMRLGGDTIGDRDVEEGYVYRIS